ncbi:MAG: hypothetical protein MUQ30_21030 [Anaerolineae bacterium]|nr:hypothetical protein [Anaerolineae bacterium]
MKKIQAVIAVALVLGALLLVACDGNEYHDEEDSTVEESPDTGDDDSTPQVVVSGDLLPRDFKLPLPLFAPDSAWNQIALDAAVLPESDQQILSLYRVLLGDNSSLHPKTAEFTAPFMYLNYDDFSIPIYRASDTEQAVLVCNYDGDLDYTNPKLPEASENPGGPVMAPAPAVAVRPSGPQGDYSDGHLVLFNPETFIAFDFWQATIVRDGECQSQGGGLAGTSVLEAGTVDFFDVRGPGANPVGYYSARASGVPLLAGLLLPEDIESGAIEHALAVAFPSPRSVNGRNPSSEDIFYPASSVEVDFYDTNPFALAQGQRIRLKDLLVIADEAYGDTFGVTDAIAIDDLLVAPITHMFLTALRTYGAYVLDASGGLTFYAEDIHSANLQLTDEEVNALIGQPLDAPLPTGLTKWQIVMEQLAEDLTSIPLASGGSVPWWEYESTGRNPGNATIGYSNFEVVEPATIP